MSTMPNETTKVLSGADLMKELDRLRAENAALAVKVQAKGSGPGLTFKTSEKGAISVYGLGRFPVTLYADQWTRLFSGIDNLKSFLAEQDKAGKLAHKP